MLITIITIIVVKTKDDDQIKDLKRKIYVFPY